MRKGHKKKSYADRAYVTKVWLKAEFEFPSAFSYRQPDASAQFAIGSPVPSPAAVKLALVDAAIRWSCSVQKGREIFDWLKTCAVYPVPPEKVVRFRVFLKRLKPEEVVTCPKHPDVTASAKLKAEKRPVCPHCGSRLNLQSNKLTESTGIRDYFLLEGCLVIFLEIPEEKIEETIDLLVKIRRLGTGDSICWCREVVKVDENEISKSLFPRPLSSFTQDSLMHVTGRRFLVVRLSDLTERSNFDAFDPFGRKAGRTNLPKEPYVLPLSMVRYGENWSVFKRIGFGQTE